jgi:hypothetical protein
MFKFIFEVHFDFLKQQGWLASLILFLFFSSYFFFNNNALFDMLFFFKNKL